MNPTKQQPRISARDVRRRFDRAADGFDDADFLHRRCFDELMARFEPMQLAPGAVLDLGSATGRGSRALSRHLKAGRVVSADLSFEMLRRARSGRRWWSRIREVQADAAQLPFRTGSFDLVVANLSVPWFSRPEASFAEVGRVLRREGLFLFATLGPDSFRELAELWHSIDRGDHVLPFADMHDVGDALVRAGLRDPVLDVERLTVSYRDSASLFRELSATGSRNPLIKRDKSLRSAHRAKAFVRTLDERAAAGGIKLTMELVFGHAWGSGPRPSDGEYRVDPASIGYRRGKN